MDRKQLSPNLYLGQAEVSENGEVVELRYRLYNCCRIFDHKIQRLDRGREVVWANLRFCTFEVLRLPEHHAVH
jgi:hypothetical protein